MSDAPITNPHDLFTRQSLSHIPTARSFIETHLPAEVVATLDLSTLQLRDGAFVDESLRENLTDLVFEVARRDEPGSVLVGILFEHKSSPEKYIALQLLRYMVNIWERQRRAGDELLVVIPVVLYHGQVKWWAKTSMRELLEAPDALKSYIPDSDTCLVDLSAIPSSTLGNAATISVCRDRADEARSTPANHSRTCCRGVKSHAHNCR
ncbi:MAG: Rpn family recombination-promoting nuclease/putative transposase [Planctomycetota bacterium]|nr:Rpn family recombination-promoting nuclease/putative transposase [Planctomycetota bacterium]